MTLKNVLIQFLGFVLLFSLFSCSSKNTSTGPEESNNYMSLSVGDIREYYDPIIGDYEVWKITGKTKRSDGTDVYIGEWSSNLDSMSSDSTSLSRTSYLAIIGNYFVSTNLEKDPNSINPYGEQRLAEISPKEGDTWVHTLGVPDSEKVYFTAKYVGNFETLAGELKDVYGYTLSNFLTVYYAKDFGHVGSSSPGDSSYNFTINYSKINGKEIGKFVPFTNAKHLSKPGGNIPFRRVNFLGQIIN